MKKIIISIVLIMMIVMLSGCVSIPLSYMDNIIYENEDKSIRLEIGSNTNFIGRIYILKDDQVHSFVIKYFIPGRSINVYLNASEFENPPFYFLVSYESTGFFKRNFDIMILEKRIPDIENPEDDIFNDLDTVLNRIYDQEVKTLNYFNNYWESTETNLIFVNNDLNDYYNNIVSGTINEEKIWISFSDETFTIWSKDDLSIKLTGVYTFDGLNIILEPSELYTEYPSIITLSFSAMYET